MRCLTVPGANEAPGDYGIIKPDFPRPEDTENGTPEWKPIWKPEEKEALKKIYYPVQLNLGPKEVGPKTRLNRDHLKWNTSAKIGGTNGVPPATRRK